MFKGLTDTIIQRRTMNPPKRPRIDASEDEAKASEKLASLPSFKSLYDAETLEDFYAQDGVGRFYGLIDELIAAGIQPEAKEDQFVQLNRVKPFKTQHHLTPAFIALNKASRPFFDHRIMTSQRDGKYCISCRTFMGRGAIVGLDHPVCSRKKSLDLKAFLQFQVEWDNRRRMELTNQGTPFPTFISKNTDVIPSLKLWVSSANQKPDEDILLPVDTEGWVCSEVITILRDQIETCNQSPNEANFQTLIKLAGIEGPTFHIIARGNVQQRYVAPVLKYHLLRCILFLSPAAQTEFFIQITDKNRTQGWPEDIKSSIEKLLSSHHLFVIEGELQSLGETKMALYAETFFVSTAGKDNITLDELSRLINPTPITKDRRKDIPNAGGRIAHIDIRAHQKFYFYGNLSLTLLWNGNLEATKLAFCHLFPNEKWKGDSTIEMAVTNVHTDESTGELINFATGKSFDDEDLKCNLFYRMGLSIETGAFVEQAALIHQFGSPVFSQDVTGGVSSALLLYQNLNINTLRTPTPVRESGINLLLLDVLEKHAGMTTNIASRSVEKSATFPSPQRRWIGQQPHCRGVKVTQVLLDLLRFFLKSYPNADFTTHNLRRDQDFRNDFIDTVRYYVEQKNIPVNEFMAAVLPFSYQDFSTAPSEQSTQMSGYFKNQFTQNDHPFRRIKGKPAGFIPQVFRTRAEMMEDPATIQSALHLVENGALQGATDSAKNQFNRYVSLAYNKHGVSEFTTIIEAVKAGIPDRPKVAKKNTFSPLIASSPSLLDDSTTSDKSTTSKSPTSHVSESCMLIDFYVFPVMSFRSFFLKHILSVSPLAPLLLFLMLLLEEVVNRPTFEHFGIMINLTIKSMPIVNADKQILIDLLITSDFFLHLRFSLLTFFSSRRLIDPSLLTIMLFRLQPESYRVGDSYSSLKIFYRPESSILSTQIMFMTIHYIRKTPLTISNLYIHINRRYKRSCGLYSNHLIHYDIIESLTLIIHVLHSSAIHLPNNLDPGSLKRLNIT